MPTGYRSAGVRAIASPRARYWIEAVQAVLKEIGAGEKASLLVFNKTDLIGDEELRDLHAEFPESVAVSARSGVGIEELLDAVAERQRELERTVILRLPIQESRSLALIYEYAQVENVEWEDGSAIVAARVDGPGFGRIMQLVGVELLESARVRRVV